MQEVRRDGPLVWSIHVVNLQQQSCLMFLHSHYISPVDICYTNLKNHVQKSSNIWGKHKDGFTVGFKRLHEVFSLFFYSSQPAQMPFCQKYSIPKKLQPSSDIRSLRKHGLVNSHINQSKIFSFLGFFWCKPNYFCEWYTWKCKIANATNKYLISMCHRTRDLECSIALSWSEVINVKSLCHGTGKNGTYGSHKCIIFITH